LRNDAQISTTRLPSSCRTRASRVPTITIGPPCSTSAARRALSRAALDPSTFTSSRLAREPGGRVVCLVRRALGSFVALTIHEAPLDLVLDVGGSDDEVGDVGAVIAKP